MNINSVNKMIQSKHKAMNAAGDRSWKFRMRSSKSQTSTPGEGPDNELIANPAVDPVFDPAVTCELNLL